MSDLDKQISILMACEFIKVEQVHNLCEKLKELLIEEGSTVIIKTPLTVLKILN